ncbi:aspartyl-phosphate phosphatase Spo0E family protein [uncultured Metabacillus sp.]|uniref:aspartyl-phosphate phosphatase Spo0E family protein n=1 Tax=uncultured Metabacillus sp. TaxID=2860135 RepID=UPI00260D1DCA|nr:aspartyl-phosphate phosphatase Spo0E family protein [uncultured Metabacillus sp.]
MNRDRLKEKLLETINNKRQEMIETANTEGLTSDSALKCSQDLDKLLNKYQLILIEEKEGTIDPFYEFVHTMTSWTLADNYALQFIEK